jgi:cytochrome c oxidase subunit II
MTLKHLPGWGIPVAAASALALLWTGPVFAGDGIADNWQVTLQGAATPISEQMHSFNTLLLVLMTAIVLLVLGLLIWVMVRYNEKANPVPSKISHNTTLEIAWTIVPVLILLVIAVPSFRLLYAQHEFPTPDVTIKATGHQWYWNYTYPDSGNFNFDSYMVDDDKLKPGQPRLLTVDNEVVVPVGKVVHVLVTSDDPYPVIHNWAVPSFGSKIDAVPGRITRTWFKPTKTGVFHGQCSELCGMGHAFMPITVRVVSDPEFAEWVAGARKKFASTMPKPQPVADKQTQNQVATAATNN